MDKKRAPYLIGGLGLLLAALVMLLAWGGRRSSGGIVLPQTPGDPSGVGGGEQGTLDVVEIAPDTVQAAIATLSRPASYGRTQTVETFWSGGSGLSLFQVYVSAGRTRLDTQLADGSVRHTILAGDTAAVWYDDETAYTALPAAGLTPDMAARMPTYEDVLDLPADRIAAADYRERDGSQCIYVETAPDEAGYAQRYWVDVETGLLIAAERDQDSVLVYRFTAGAPTGGVEDSLFLLPDGGTLSP